MQTQEISSKEWSEQLAFCERLVPIIGQLSRERRVQLNIFGSRLGALSAIDILKVHRYARHVLGFELPAKFSFELAEQILASSVSEVDLDLGRIFDQKPNGMPASEIDSLLDGINREKWAGNNRDVVLYGFGRIGRLVARIISSQSTAGLRLRAIVVRRGSAKDLTKRASLLRRDSVHGRFDGVIKVSEETNELIINGSPVKVIYANSPSEIDYESFGISNALLIDNTGIWRDEEGLGQHLSSPGIEKVLLTAPGKGALKNIVFGINNGAVTAEDRIITAASCTTNAITPVLKVLLETFGIQHGHVETVHSYTNDQNLIDNFHKGERRGRSAAMNMVITETGAAKAVAKALPELAGKLTGNAIRVPTPNVSLAILNLQLDTQTTKESLNETLRQASIFSNLHEQIDFVDSPEVVSSDFVGSNRAGIVDGLATIVEGNNAVIYVWYDNEYGYSHQVIRLAQQMSGLQLVSLPTR